MFTGRRTSALEAIGPRACAIIPTARVAIRNNDVEHEFRPGSDLYYLTGLDEPDSILMLLPGHSEHQTLLFVRPRDPEREIWDGPRAGIEGAVQDFGADAAFPVHEFGAKLSTLLSGRDRLYYALGEDRAMDDQILSAISTQRARSRKGASWPTEIVDPAVVIHEMRWRKSDDEVDRMRRAAEISRDAFFSAFSIARPERFEYEVDAALREAFRARGSKRPAYSPIVASGHNACVLHYVANSRKMMPNELLLIDAGAEFDCYASDVTRTFPIDGRFTAPQREIYQLVLDAQLASIAAVKPGATLLEIHQRSVETITQGLDRLGILSGDPAEIIKAEGYKKYFMHGTSHWLGMDVHDVGPYYVDGKPRPLEARNALTVEPGIYISPNDMSAPAEYRGIGVRIEDDVLVTENGHFVLTHDIPKDPDELERCLNRN
jgi:Xaa-Pro aminopeptidase